MNLNETPGTDLYLSALSIAQGPNPDLQRAHQLLKDAEQLGYSKAQMALASWYFHGQAGVIEKNIPRAVELYTAAARQFEPDACYELALYFEKGEILPEDFIKARSYYMKAALLGHKQAIFEMGRCFYYGIGEGAGDKVLAEICFEIADHFGTTRKIKADI